MLYYFRITLLVAISLFTLTNAAAQNQDPILVNNDVSSLLSSLKNVATSKNLEDAPVFKVSDKKTFVLNLNVEKVVQKERIFIGAIGTTKNSSFTLSFDGKVLKGHILEKAANRAYNVFSLPNKKVYLEETNINTILCVDYLKSTTTTQKSPSSLVAKMAPTTLESRPGATAVVYLDFDGETVSGTSWRNGNTINAEPAGFSDAEIIRTWEIMAEDFSPFKINITTNRAVYEQAPNNQKMLCIFTPTDTAAPGSGGVAFINSFSSNANNPCWVYNIRNAKEAGDTGSHEVGHTLGLNHDGKGTTEYYRGHNDWAPIMGFSPGKPIAQWSFGEYSNASNTEDDIAIITNSRNNFGFIPDDHGDDIDNATELIANGAGVVDETENRGILHNRQDTDVYSFLAQSGDVSFQISPAENDPNLDISARILDASGAEVAVSNPNNTLVASFSTALPAGLYYLEIDGVGNRTVEDGYSDYASIGQYVISGQYTVQSPEIDLRIIAVSPDGDDFICGDVSPVVTVRNSGSNTINGFDVNYALNGDVPNTFSTNTVLAQDEEVTLTLPVLILENAGDTELNINVIIENDDIPSNNAATTEFFGNKAAVAAQANTFENDSDALIAFSTDGNDSVWERGVASGSVLNQTATNNTSYVTNLNGDYPDGRTAYLITNCYDLSTIDTPVLKFDMAFDLESNFDILYVDYSIDGGTTWNILGTSDSQPAWYNSNRTNASSGNDNDCQNCPGAQWTGTNAPLANYGYDFTANATLGETDLTQESNVLFRFVFQSDNFITNEGVLIDNLIMEGSERDDDDDDNDGILDVDDNCPLTPNPNQLDSDGDGIGDLCDDDDDNDGIPDVDDNCILTANADQEDTDGDGIGNVCEDFNDDDGDGVANDVDNCPSVPNANQADGDNDGIGDSCDPDLDNDSILNEDDNCPLISNPDQLDSDGDGIGDICDRDNDNDGIDDENDNCPFIANPNQEDTDNDGIGDVCDNANDDEDGDGINNDVDNCPLTANPDQLDSDGDGTGDVCDNDDDNDTVLDIVDNCPLTANTDQADYDNDGIGDVCDADLDNDTVQNTTDLCNRTPLGARVDASGCQVFFIARENYSVASTDERCRDLNDGTISIATSESYTYTAVITDGTISQTQDFTTNALFEGLETGNYSVCITVAEDANYQECFELAIDEPEVFEVVPVINPVENTLSLEISGGGSYTIVYGEETITDNVGFLSFPITDSRTQLTVTSERDCEAVFEELILLQTDYLVYPNPVANGELFITSSGVLEPNISLRLYNMGGVLLRQAFIEDATNDPLRLDVLGLASGNYILNIETASENKAYKVIIR